MFTLETGSGLWNPLIWVLIIAIAFLLFYGIRGFGKSTYKKGTGQTKAFLSGNEEASHDQMHVSASNLYWGFTTSLKNVYSLLKKMHNGNVSDYVLWFLVVVAIVFLLMGVM